MAEVPGTPAKHAIITDACRTGRGDAGAFDEAVERLRHEYAAILEGWEGTPGLQLHLVLTLEKP